MNADNRGARAVPTSTANDEVRLQVSALVDGELDDATVERTIDALLASDDLARFWADAHRAGDWMRSDEVVGVGDGARFLRDFSLQLAAEPTVLAPSASPSRSSRFWVRTGLPGAAVAAALLAVVWVAAPFGRHDGPGNLVAAQPTTAAPTVVASAEPESTAVDPERLSDYFAAHRDVTPFGYRGAAARPAVFTPSSSPSR